MMKHVRNFYVVGGGCFGSQYVRWLLRAQQLGMIGFEKIFAIDRNPGCRLRKELDNHAQLSIVESDWVEFLSGWLRDRRQEEGIDLDHWVPAPLSPHLFFLSFLEAARHCRPEMNIQTSSFQEGVPTPVRIPLTSENLAVSFAEWQCPVNCIEPPRCPAIKAARTWDMKTAVEGYFKNFSQRSTHVLQCKHLVHGVATLTMKEIADQFEVFLQNLGEEKYREFVVATTSGCHGIIGRAVRFTNEGVKPESPAEPLHPLIQPG